MSIDAQLAACIANPSPLWDLNKSSRQQVAWWCGCGHKHHQLMQTVNATSKQCDAFMQAGGAAGAFKLPCPYCRVGTRNMSEVQKRATNIIFDLWPDQAVCFDVCIPGSGVKSSADALVGGVMVMVDGAGHFGGMLTTGATESQWVDRRFDLAAYEGSFNVVRLHGSDSKGVWRATLLQAKGLAASGARFILYSPHYGLPACVDARDVQTRCTALIAQACLAMGDRDQRPGHNRKRKGYCKG